MEEFLNEKRVAEAEEKLEEQLLRLAREENFDLVVEFKKGQENNYYLRIVDSIFWFV